MFVFFMAYHSGSSGVGGLGGRTIYQPQATDSHLVSLQVAGRQNSLVVSLSFEIKATLP